MRLGKVCSLAAITAFALATGTTTRLAAQAIPGSTQPGYSRFDLYGGYGWFHPLNSGIAGKQYQDITSPNATVSATYYFNRFVGVQAEGGYFSGQNEHLMYDANCVKTMCDQLIYTAEGGPVLRLPLGRVVPFIHALGGGERTNGPVDQSLMWGWGVTGGIGVDYVLPFFHDHLAIRPIQADFQYSQVVYGPLHLPSANVGGFGEIDALKLSGGLVFRMGDIKEKPPLALGCIAEPMSVYAGEPVTITGQTTGLNPKRHSSWRWEANGGTLQPHEATVIIDTTGLQAGEYTAAGHLSQGPKANEQASCEVPFTVHTHAVTTITQQDTTTSTSPAVSSQPTVSCSANPASATAGNTIDITAVGTSPTNRPLTYSYSTTGGTIAGNGPSARLSTAGLGDGLITVTCNVTDDQGQRASATTSVSISSAAVPVIPNTQSLCSINFTRDSRRPARVDNEAKACLDDVALTLGQQGSDARLVMIGNTSDNEAATVAAERALNARQYLTDAKGIDASRIELRVGTTSGRTLDNVLVPSGATYDNGNTQTFDETQIKRHGEAYGIHHGSAAPVFGTHTTARRAATHHARHTATPRRKAAPSATFTGTSNPPDLHIAPVPTPARDDTNRNPGTPVTSIPPLK